MDDELTNDRQITEWIAKWQKSGGAERANYQLFLTELCDVLGVDHPDPTQAEEPENAYVFEKNVVFNNHDGTSSTKRVDLYRRGCFVCETKQGVEAKDDEQLLSTASQEICKKRKTGHGQRGTKSLTTRCSARKRRPSSTLAICQSRKADHRSLW